MVKTMVKMEALERRERRSYEDQRKGLKGKLRLLAVLFSLDKWEGHFPIFMFH